MYGIYKIYNNDELLYVGKTSDFATRIRKHISEKEWRDQITHIETAECKTEIDMDIYEKYYINKLKAKYNIALVYEDAPTFKIEELNFKRYDLKKFLDKHKQTQAQSFDKTINKAMEDRKQKMNDLLKNSTEVQYGRKINLFELESSLIHWYNEDRGRVTFVLLNGLDFWKNFLKDFNPNDYEMTFGQQYIIQIKNGESIWNNWDKNEFRMRIYSYNINKEYTVSFEAFNITPTAQYDNHTKEIVIKLDKGCLEDIGKYFIIHA